MTCTPIGPRPRGDADYCRWRMTDRGIVIETTGRPVKVVVVIRARLKDDPNTWVTQRTVIRTQS
ncbi:MAG: hypothetical protein ACKOT0_08070 [bacterium]